MKIANKQRFYNSLILIIAILIVDLISKKLMFSYLDFKGGRVEILPFFNLVKVYNPGVSFGLFDDLAYGRYILVVAAGAVVVFLLRWLAKEEDKKISLALSLIIGGALGNIIDRLINGAVADFLDFLYRKPPLASF